MKFSRHSLLIIFFTTITVSTRSQGIVPCYSDADKVKGRLWGFCDRFFSDVIIKCQFDTTFAFTEGLGRIRVAGKYGYVDKTGKQVIPPKYELADAFSEGLAMVVLNGRISFIDTKGVDVFKKTFKRGTPFRNGLAMVINDEDKTGYIDTKGNTIIPFSFKRGYSFNGGMAPVLAEDGKAWFAINKKGETLFTFSDKVKNVLEPFNEGIAPVYVDGPAGYNVHYDFVNERGEFICDAPYVTAEPFKNGRAIIAYENKKLTSSLQFWKYGLIKRGGLEIVRAQYACLEESPIPGIYFYGKTSVSLSNCSGYGLLDSMGTELTEPIYQNFTKLNDTTFLCKEAGKYESLNQYLLLTTKGKQLFSLKYKNKEFEIAGTDTLLTLWSETTSLVMSLYNTQKGIITQNSFDGLYVLGKQKVVLVPDSDYPGGSILSLSGTKLVDSVQTQTLNQVNANIEDVPFILLKKRNDPTFRLFNINTLKYVPVNYDFGSRAYGFSNDYSEGMLAVKQKDKWGFIDSTGKLKIPLLYTNAKDFHSGWAVVGKKGKEEYSSSTMVYINKAGKEMPGIKAGFLEASDFKEGFAFYQKSDESNDDAVYYINTSGKVIFKTESTDFRKQDDFNSGMAAVCNKEGKYGYINTKGELVIPYQYSIPDKKEYAFYLKFDKTGNALVEKDGKKMVIDKTGKVVR